jgi:hypothetical protein
VAPLRVPHVDVGRRNVEIAAEDERRFRIGSLLQPAREPIEPRQLRLVEGRLVTAVVPRTSEMVSLKLYSVRPLGLTDTLRTLQNLGLSVTEELQITLPLRPRALATLVSNTFQGVEVELLAGVDENEGVGRRSSADRSALAGAEGGDGQPGLG